MTPSWRNTILYWILSATRAWPWSRLVRCFQNHRESRAQSKIRSEIRDPREKKTIVTLPGRGSGPFGRRVIADGSRCLSTDSSHRGPSSSAPSPAAPPSSAGGRSSVVVCGAGWDGGRGCRSLEHCVVVAHHAEGSLGGGCRVTATSTTRLFLLCTQ